MSFKQFGGLNYAAKNNIVGSLYSSSTNSGTANIIGLENSKITSQSHLDMSANSLMHIGSLYFMDGTIQSTAYANSSGTAPTFNDGINIIGPLNLNGNESITGSLTVTGASSLQGGVTGNVRGNLTGNVTGNLTGNVTGNLTGNVTGNVTGNLTGIATTSTNLAAGLTYEIPYQIGAGKTSFIAKGTTGYVLTSNGDASSPTWSPPNATITTINATTNEIANATLYPVMTTSPDGTGKKPYVDTNGLTYDSVNNALTTGKLVLTGSTIGGNTMAVTGTTSLQGTTTTSLSATTIDASTTLNVTGLTTLTGPLTANGGTLTKELTVTGKSTLKDLTIVTTGGIDVNGGVRTDVLTINTGDETITRGDLNIINGNETIHVGNLTVAAGIINADGGCIYSNKTAFNLLTDSSSPYTPRTIKFGSLSGTINIPSMTRSGSSSTGALVVAGGVGIQGDLYNLPLLQSSSVTAFFDNVNIAGNLVFPQGSLFTVNNLQANGYANVSSDLNVGGNAVIIGNLTVDGTLNYTNLTISGALTVDGESYLNGGISVVNNSTSMFSVNEATGNTIIGPTSGTTATLDVYGSLKIFNSGNVAANTTSGADIALNLSSGGAFINKDLMVCGGNIYGSNGGTLNLSATSVTAPTPPTGDNSTKIATTAFVKESVTSGSNPIGSIIMFAGTSPPANYLWCNGQTLSTTTYISLYSIIGRTYGGSGENFILPNLQSRFPLGSDTMGTIKTNYNGGDTLSSGNRTMNVGQLASHSHDISNTATVVDTPNNYFYMSDLHGPNNHNMFYGGSRTGLPTSTNAQGSSEQYLPPFIVVNYIIRYQ